MPKLCNNMYNNYHDEKFDYYYPYAFNNEDVDYLFSINPCKVEIPLGNNYDIPVTMDNYILVNENDIIYYGVGESPSTTTEAEVGTKAYNVVDLKSWECVSIYIQEISENQEVAIYNWVQDQVFTFSDTAPVVVELPEAYYSDKNLHLSIYNFRYELIYETTQEAHKDSYFNITVDLAEQYFYNKGLYYLQADLISENEKNTVILPDTFVIAII